MILSAIRGTYLRRARACCAVHIFDTFFDNDENKRRAPLLRVEAKFGAYLVCLYIQSNALFHKGRCFVLTMYGPT